MLCIKKVCRDELLQLALIISLLRVNQNNNNFENDLFNNIGGTNDLDFPNNNGTSWRRSSYTPNILRNHYINPKSLDSVLLNYERDLFADLNSLGRYNRDRDFRHRDVQTYLLNIERNAASAGGGGGVAINNSETLTTNSTSSNNNNLSNNVLTPTTIPPTSTNSDDLNLTQEDMDLIEVLWKQDVDLGFSLELARQEEQLKEKLLTSPLSDSLLSSSSSSSTSSEYLKDKPDNVDASTSILATSTSHHAATILDKDIIDKELINDAIKKEEPDVDSAEEDIWAGVDYTIDTETGEYVIKGEPIGAATDVNSSCDLEDFSNLPLPEFLLDEALRLVELEDENSQQKNASGLLASLEALENSNKKAAEENSAANVNNNNIIINNNSNNNNNTDLGDEFDFFDDMIQTQFHVPHHRAAFQNRMPFMMDQHFQDANNFLSPSEIHPYGTHHALPNYGHPHAHSYVGSSSSYDTRSVLLNNATLPTPMGDLNNTMAYGNLGGTIGNAVATSMNLTNLTNSSEPMREPTSATQYKLEPSNDMMYYQNTTGSEFSNNQTDVGFFSNLLNETDMHDFMDMAMNEGMGQMRTLEVGINMNSTHTSSAVAAAAVSASTTLVSKTNSRRDLERIDTSSDSAVSSMGSGSERVPSLSDGEWCDGGSDSGHTTTGEQYPLDYHHHHNNNNNSSLKYRPIDYYQNRLATVETAASPVVAQKKYLLYGKSRFPTTTNGGFQGFSDYRAEPSSSSSSSAAAQFQHHHHHHHHQNSDGSRLKMPEIKYSCSADFNPLPRTNPLSSSLVDHIQHNHSYHLIPAVENSGGVMQRPISRDKLLKSSSSSSSSSSRKSSSDEAAAAAAAVAAEHLSRDEKRARAIKIPITVDDIINLPMDEFNERLSKHELTDEQVSLIRDIRRRGKNKVAAQNCRKRKLDQILSLADEVKDMRDRKLSVLNDHKYTVVELKRMRDKYQQLYAHIFQSLRDSDGNPYSPHQYSLQITADDSILIVPKSNNNGNMLERKEPSSQNQKR